MDLEAEEMQRLIAALPEEDPVEAAELERVTERWFREPKTWLGRLFWHTNVPGC